MYTETTSDFDFARSLLTPGEIIRWRGKPEKGNLFTGQDFFLIPFSIFWCGFAIFWEITAITGGAPFFFALFGVPFVLVGLYLVFGRFLYAAWIRKRTFYVITSKKIIRKRGNRIDTIDGRNLPMMNMVIHKNGNGTIRFGDPRTYYYRGHNGWDYNHGLFTLENIPDPTRVNELIASMEK